MSKVGIVSRVQFIFDLVPYTHIVQPLFVDLPFDFVLASSHACGVYAKQAEEECAGDKRV